MGKHEFKGPFHPAGDLELQGLKLMAREAGMDNERVRAICIGMPHVTEVLNWGHHLVYFVGDRDIAGKMFAMTDLDGTGFGVLWFHCGEERFHELLEVEGISASPYLARAHWVTVERWDVLRAPQIEDELKRAYALIFEKLSPRTKKILAMPAQEREQVIKDRKKLLATRAKEPAVRVKAARAKTPAKRKRS